MICKQCNKEFGNGQFCQHCKTDRIVGGAELEGFGFDAGKPKLASNKTDSGLIPCCYCMEMIPNDCKHCPYCGKKLYKECLNCKHVYISKYRYCPECGTNEEEFRLKLKQEEEQRLREERIRKIQELRKAEEERKKAADERLRLSDINSWICRQPEYINALAEIEGISKSLRKELDKMTTIDIIVRVIIALLIGLITGLIVQHIVVGVVVTVCALCVLFNSDEIVDLERYYNRCYERHIDQYIAYSKYQITRCFLVSVRKEKRYGELMFEYDWRKNTLLETYKKRHPDCLRPSIQAEID